MLLLLALLGCKKDEPTEPVEIDGSRDPIEAYDPLDYVVPINGTYGLFAEIANINPGATVPFGMTLVGPETRSSEWGAPPFYHCAGYHYHDDMIDGFGHAHDHGMGVVDYSTIVVMPKPSWDDSYTSSGARSTLFSHDDETAVAGKYEVTLSDDTHVELTATQRSAHHRYTFAVTDSPTVIFDLGHAVETTRVEGAEISVDLDAGSVEGFQTMMGNYSGRFGGLDTWFSAVFDPAPIAAGSWSDPDAPVADQLEADGTVAGAWVQFPEGTEEVQMRIGLSYVDLKGARANRKAELPDLDFESRVTEAQDAWRDVLGKVRVRSESEEDLRIFHTRHYHAYIMPSRIDDVDGRYRGFDQEIHDTDHPYYTDFSLWDTFRTQHPWLILTQPDVQTDMVKSLVKMMEDGGNIPKWPLGHGYTSGMVGTPADQVMAETWLKGLQDWDADSAFDEAFHHAQNSTPNAGRAAVESYVDFGWVPEEHAGASASRTLEFTWNDHALARWADAMGRKSEAKQLWKQSDGWKNLWDDKQGFFVARKADGSFVDLVDKPFFWYENWYTEGNAWHYRWGVPFDVPGMIDLQYDGDVDAFQAEYDEYWANVYAEEDDFLPDDYYWHGNEPVLHYAFLGSLAGRPDSTAEASRWVMRHRYWDDTRALDGNDDGGTLSAWFLFASIGLYPVAGTPDYAIASPIFERVEIDLPGDEQLVIRAPGASEEAMYVHHATLGGEQLYRSVITHEELLDAGELLLHMVPEAGGWEIE